LNAGENSWRDIRKKQAVDRISEVGKKKKAKREKVGSKEKKKEKRGLSPKKTHTKRKKSNLEF